MPTGLSDAWVRNGNYPSNSTGNHAVVVTGVRRDSQGNIQSITIAEQWAARPPRNDQDRGRDPQPVQERDLTPGEINEYRVIGRKKCFSRQPGTGEWSEILDRPGLAIEVMFDGQSRKTSEVILRANTSEDVVALRRHAVRQFGFDWTGEYGDLEKHWASADRRTAVEFWRRRYPTESASLCLIDKRGAEELR